MKPFRFSSHQVICEETDIPHAFEVFCTCGWLRFVPFGEEQAQYAAEMHLHTLGRWWDLPRKHD